MKYGEVTISSSRIIAFPNFSITSETPEITESANPKFFSLKVILISLKPLMLKCTLLLD